MAATARHESTHPKGPSAVSLLSSWTQQGAQTFFAAQRILLDLVMRQNASILQALRQQLTDPHHSPTAMLGEIAGEGMTNFIEGQKVLLELGKEQNEILMTSVKERVGDCPQRMAAADLLRRSVETFINMQEEFLKIAGKQTHTWMEAAKAGKPYQPDHLVSLAREGMDTFVKAQKRFLDVIAEETSKAARAKPGEGVKKLKKTELREVARKATESFIEAQKRLVDVAGKQANANIKTVGKALEFAEPLPFLRLGELTREAVKSYVDAQKALAEVIARPANGHHPAGKTERKKRPVRAARAAAAVA